MPATHLTYPAVSIDDFETLLALRILAMRPSLEQLGRFDPERARARFVASFEPQHTRHICVDNLRVGFFAVKPMENDYLLDHLYLHPTMQGQGIGARVLQHIFALCGAQPLRVGALRGSDANRFYQAHGFVQVDEGEWDIYYRRTTPNTASV
jgi:GNAT superfamily N-acetyltransferase